MYFISDWTILNDTSTKQLKRILADFHHLSESEIHLACILLDSYHRVYRRDRLQQRRNQLTSNQPKIKEFCLPPTDSQLQEIARYVNAKTDFQIGTQEIFPQLQTLARNLRQYHIDVRIRFKSPGFWDQRINQAKPDRIELDDSEDNGAIMLVPTYLF